MMAGRYVGRQSGLLLLWLWSDRFSHPFSTLTPTDTILHNNTTQLSSSTPLCLSLSRQPPVSEEVKHPSIHRL